jgi:hypothetical protein
MMVAAISGSMMRSGIFTSPRAASVSVTLWASVNAVTILTTLQKPRATAKSARRNSR